MDWTAVKQDWRVWLLGMSLVLSLSMIVNPADPYTRTDGTVQLKTNIEQGLDLQGGARVMIVPTQNVSKQTVNQIIQTLQTRISAFGLQEMDIREVSVGGQPHVQIELAGANTSDLTELINRTGRFEARIPMAVANGEQITVGKQSYPVSVDTQTVTVGNETYEPGDNFTLSSGPRDIRFTFVNITDGEARLSPLAFSGQDILNVDINPRVSGVTGSGNQWQFQFQVSVTEEAAHRVKDVVQHFPQGARGNLQEARLVLTLDESRVSSLQISNAFKNQLIQQPVINGGAESREAAEQEMEELKSVLESGALPVPIRIVSTTTVSATLGQQFLRTAIIAIVAAIIAVALVIFIRYRDPRIVVPLTVTGFSELILILGFFADTSIGVVHFVELLVLGGIGTYYCYRESLSSVVFLYGGGFLLLVLLSAGPTLDLPAIAGIIAAVGTGVDDQIIITDERGKRKLQSFKQRFKRAFFIIFTSAASTIAAMFPLIQIGAGTIQSFAITTIVGVIMGVAITRPAYARVLQYMET